MKRALTDRERKFCQEVVRGMSATQAAKNAGWPTEGSAASVTATRLMKRQDILAELARLR